MKERIKLIWDFRGPDAMKIAKHHAIHLHEFAEKEALNNPLTGVESISKMHFVAYLVVDKSVMIAVRDALKPHRGTIFMI
ncbi:MAG: hypothetical protein COZ75_00720 [Flavobacteriaceae bacterium CG_4_8_14_3_um_filter_34_10]|nr:hypothetical protein [Flavobacteriia bacterium]PIQ19582.1 MAG: hypothetical protein COW66_00485 [Flavobacteriaceae bacterium CG18_big_fil_WC_8_21_14_2_50_34_36]PIV51212.1 MAG: hypothetical protein COS19_02030 [Flavobacteriaceae bacterium CG02_land_8_20_14_3_00_34_13]PIX10609.1 MAG: hypothetical protein COZ75_00720 [Flavobacteriaceae bacterium CG_4_8_14_3_um_filter_34_10]PIZ07854.1 MAG: hypothetical protein COY56_06870 [Flavobacteriaceae bacterium CG_4_10_14_0_8_um_filter_34_31]PJC06038.1 MA